MSRSRKKNASPNDQVLIAASKSFGISELCDATLVALDDGAKFRVHRFLLAASSPVLRNVFTYDDNQERIFKLGQVSTVGLNHILEWIYNRKLGLQIDDLELKQVLVDAMYLGMCRELIDVCVNTLSCSLSSSNAIGHFTFSKTYGVLQLRTKCKELIEYDFERVAGGTEFLSLQLEDLEELLQSDRLNAEETTVWLATMRWVEHDLASRAAHVPRLIASIRTSLLPNCWANALRDVFTSKEGPQQLESVKKALAHLHDDRANRCLYAIPNSGDQLSEKRLPADVVLAFGGWHGIATHCVVESYDARADRWQQLPLASPHANRAYLGTVVIGTKVFLIGGTGAVENLRSASLYDSVTSQFEATNSMHEARCYVSVANLNNQHIFAMGGLGRSPAERLNSVEYFDVATNQWHKAPPMHQRRSDAGGVAANDKIYVVGGFDGSEQLSSAEVYNPSTGKWTLLSNMPNRRSGHAVVSDGRFIYALGGTENSRRHNSCCMFDISAKKWMQMAPMLHPRSNFAAVVVGQGILVAGGYTGTSSTASTEFYSFQTRTWQKRSPMRISRSAFSMCVIKGPHLPKELLERHACPKRKTFSGNL